MSVFDQAREEAVRIFRTTDRTVEEEMSDLTEGGYLLARYPGVTTDNKARIIASEALAIVQAERATSAPVAVADVPSRLQEAVCVDLDDVVDPPALQEAAVVADPTVESPDTPAQTAVVVVATKDDAPTVPAEGFRALALRAAARGQRPLPIKPGAKNPCVKWKGSAVDTTSTEEWSGVVQSWIDECAEKFPDANCCVVAKPDEYLFIDEDDSEKFRAGFETFSGKPFPRTFTTESRPGHRQSHWLQTDATRKMGNIGQDRLGFLSVRQRNYYILSEGSRHPFGSLYRVVDETPAIPMPDEMVEYILRIKQQHLTEKKTPEKKQSDQPETTSLSEGVGPDSEGVSTRLDGPKIPYGEHETTLFKIGSKLRRQGLEQGEIGDRLIAICEARCIGYEADYVQMSRAKAESVCKYPAGTGVLVYNRMTFDPSDEEVDAILQQIAKTSDKKESKNGSAVLTTRRGDQVKTKKIRWLWDQRVPFGKLSVFAGNPDQGKSLVTMYIAGQLTTGRPLYGSLASLPASEVLVMAGEDDADDTIVPRLQASQADLTKVHIVQSVTSKDGKGTTLMEREAQLDTDICLIETMLASRPEIRMVIVDPLSNYLGRANMNREQEVRQVLIPLKNLAARLDVAILAVMHLNKSVDASAIHRVGGAVAFTGVARAAWLFTEEPAPDSGQEDATGIPGDTKSTGRHLMLRIKGNIARPVGGLVYKIQARPVLVEGSPESQPFVEWLDQTSQVASDVLVGGKVPGRPAEKTQDAKAWLTDFLGRNGAESAEDVRTFGKRAGHTWRTLKRAKAEIEAVSKNVDRRWYWVMKGREDSLDDLKDVVF